MPNAPVVAGTVATLDSTTRSFRLAPDGRVMRYSGDTVIRNGTVSELANGRRVRVLGSAPAGELVARELVFLPHR